MTQVVLDDAEDDLPTNPPSLLEEVQETLHVVASLKHKTFVVKLGGSTLSSQRAVLQDLVWLHELGAQVILVHGGGPAITAWLQWLGIPTRFEQGLRVTDAQTLEVVRMVLCGQINQELVALASELGGDAVGLCGTDGKMVQAHVANERLGLVGQIDKIDASLVLHMIDLGYLPIIAPLGLGPDGGCLNINADDVASHLAGALKADRLIFLSDVNGIHLADGSHLAEINEAQAQTLIEQGVISDGMIPKIRACLAALAEVPCVHIVDGSTPHVLLSELEEHPHVGTIITRSFDHHGGCRHASYSRPKTESFSPPLEQELSVRLTHELPVAQPSCLTPSISLASSIGRKEESMPQPESVRKRMPSVDGYSFRFERRGHTLFVNDLQVCSLRCEREVVELVTEQKRVRVSGATYWEMIYDDLVPTKLLAGGILARYDALVGHLQRLAAEKNQGHEEAL